MTCLGRTTVRAWGMGWTEGQPEQVRGAWVGLWASLSRGNFRVQLVPEGTFQRRNSFPGISQKQSS